MSLEFKRLTYYDRVNEIIDGLRLKDSPNDNQIIKNRFLYEVMHYEYKRDSTKKYYDSLRFIMTIGSILLPAILSIGQMDPAKLPKNFEAITYWTSWSLSLTITACNGFLQLFSLDKNYIAYSLVTEQLKTEGWQYFQLSGKYENADNHQQSFKQFCKSIEGVKRKQIEQEYNGKGEDKKNKFNFDKELNNTLPPQYQNSSGTSGPLPNPSPNPLQSIGSAIEMVDTVGELKDSLEGGQSGKKIAKSITDDVIDKSLERVEEGRPNAK